MSGAPGTGHHGPGVSHNRLLPTSPALLACHSAPSLYPHRLWGPVLMGPRVSRSCGSPAILKGCRSSPAAGHRSGCVPIKFFRASLWSCRLYRPRKPLGGLPALAVKRSSPTPEATQLPSELRALWSTERPGPGSDGPERKQGDGNAAAGASLAGFRPLRGRGRAPGRPAKPGADSPRCPGARRGRCHERPSRAPSPGVRRRSCH